MFSIIEMIYAVTVGISQSSRLTSQTCFLFVHCHSLGSCLTLHFTVILCFVIVFLTQRYIHIFICLIQICQNVDVL